MENPIRSRVLPFTDVVLTTVQPLEKTSHVETIDPTVMDTFYSDCYVPVLFAYRLADNSDSAYSQVVTRIKHSLQKVLIPFFSFAGRWVSSRIWKRKLLCNDEGVPFIEAYVDMELDSLVQISRTTTSFQPVPELQGYGVLGMDITQSKQEMQEDGAPPIFVQITRFKCGGVVLAVTFNHMSTDGRGFFNFMKAWSDLSRTNDTKVAVDHNRARAEIAQIGALMSSKRAGLTDTASTEQGSGLSVEPAKLGLWAMKSFEIASSTIKTLKEEAKQSQQGCSGYVSTEDCIVAHLWRSLGFLPSSLLGGKDLAVTRVVEGRSRFYDPPLTDLCGNVFTVLLPPKIPNDEVQTMPLASIASELNDALNGVRREEWLSLEMCGKVLQAFGSNQLAVMWTTSWLKFPMYEMDFGFGKPYFAFAVNSFYSGKGLGKAYVFPPAPNSSSDSVATLHVWSTPEVLHALESNPDFLPFFLAEP
ncbi:unnamed protein product [Calypogeia fissa]